MNPDVTRVGILGAGQLGRMLALAGLPLGLEFRFFDPGPGESVAGIGRHDRAAWDDDDALRRFADAVDVVTWEFENVPVATVERLAGLGVTVHPSVDALRTAQDRLFEKERFGRLGIPTNLARAAGSAAELEEAIEEIGVPCVLKTRRMGYDGKGQRVLRGDGPVPPAEELWRALGETPLLVEAFVPFRRELSLVAVRSPEGEVRAWPVVENVHVEGILRRTTAPAPGWTPELQERAESRVAALLNDFDYVGVIGVEFFETAEGELLANEIAPRVHNTGHWTQDGAGTSQFENHLRAVIGLPLGDTSARHAAAMVNLIGRVPEPVGTLLPDGAHLHLYGKSSRPGRKLGHVNLIGADAGEVAEAADRIEGSAPIG